LSGLSMHNFSGENSSRFKYYSEESLTIASISSKLTVTEMFLRNFILESLVNNEAPVKVDGLQHVLNARQKDINAIVKTLVEKRTVVKDDAGDIVFAYPVSALPTSHRVSLRDGRKLYAMCAVDAMGVSFAFKQDIKIDSVCRYCNTKVSMTIKNGEIAGLYPETTHVLHVELNKLDNWAGSC